MASVYVMTEPPTDIDYSLVDGRVRRFVLFGQKMYDEDDGTSIDGWRDRLVEFVRIQGLDVDKDGHGLHAFVYKMQDDGLLPNAKVSGAGPASFSTDGLAEIEAEETELKRMAESGYMLSDTDYCCDVVCREHAVRMLRGLLSANMRSDRLAEDKGEE